MGGKVHILRQPSSDRVHARPTDSRASMDSRKASERGSERGHGSHWKENRKTSMFFHHFLSCFLMFGGSSVSSKSQMQQRYFDTWVFPRMAFQTPHHRISVPGGETPKARQKEGIWWLLVG